MRPGISVRGFFRPSVHPSVRPSVTLLFRIRENAWIRLLIKRGCQGEGEGKRRGEGRGWGEYRCADRAEGRIWRLCIRPCLTITFFLIDDLFEQSIRILSFKIHNNLLPGEISSFFDKNVHCYNTRGARNNLFVTLSDKRSIKSLVPASWNSLPLPLKQCPSVASFKINSKNALLAPYKSFSCYTRNCQSCLV